MKIFSKFYIYFPRKLGNISHNLTLFLASTRSCLQFQWNRKYFSSVVLRVRNRLLVALCGNVSIYLKRKVKYHWFLHEGFILDLIVFLVRMLQSVYCSKYSANTTNFSIVNLFLYFLHLFFLKHFSISVTEIRSDFTTF